MIHVKRNRNTVIVWNDSDKLTGIILAKCKKIEWEDLYDTLRENKNNMHPCCHIEFLLLDPEYMGNYHPVERFLDGRDSKILDDDEVAKELYMYFYENASLKISPKGVEYSFIG